MINIGLSFLIIIITINLFIAILVLLKNYKSKTNYLFFLMVFFLILWTVSNYFQNEVYVGNLRPFFFKADFATALFASFFFYLFCLNFPKEKKISKIRIIVFLFLVLTLAIFSLFTGLILKDIYFREGIVDAKEGPLFLFYVLFIIFILLSGIKDLFFKYFRLKSVQRMQVLYTLIGLFISASVIFIINLVLAVFFTPPLEVLRVGIYSIVFFSIFTALAITKYHLFNIKVIFAGALLMAIGFVLLFQFLTAPNHLMMFVSGGVLLLFIILGYLLIRSVLQEIQFREQLEAANRELKRLDEAKTEFLSIASHQLRTPLTAIKGYLGMIEEGIYGEVSEKVKEVLHKINDSNERLIRLVNSLLDISRIELGRMEFEFEKVDIEEMLENIVDEFHIAARKKGLKLFLERPKEKLPEVVIDALKMRRVFLNLVDNAIKYTYQGEIIVRAELKDHGRERIRVSVSDTGMGIARGEINQIFKIYRRGTGVRLFPEGSGVGLYVAKKIVEAHNGKIWVKSQGKGKGSTFYVEIPVKNYKYKKNKILKINQL